MDLDTDLEDKASEELAVTPRVKSSPMTRRKTIKKTRVADSVADLVQAVEGMAESCLLVAKTIEKLFESGRFRPA